MRTRTMPVWQLNALNGENKLRVEGATPAEAWHRAVEAAAQVLRSLRSSCVVL
jgi:hypothetical protein